MTWKSLISHLLPVQTDLYKLYIINMPRQKLKKKQVIEVSKFVNLLCTSYK